MGLFDFFGFGKRTTRPDDLRDGKWIDVVSSNVTAFRYLWDNQILEVQFHGGGRTSAYQYYDVPIDVAQQFRTAPSHGKFVHQVLKNYNYARVI